MHSNPRRAIAFFAALAALVLASSAWADTGPQAASDTSTAPANGGTAAGRAPAVEHSGGVAGPAVKPGARSSQQPAQEQPPQVETTPTQTTPNGNGNGTGTTPNTAPTAPDNATQAPAPGAGVSSGGGGGSSAGGLPTTGLALGGLTAVGLGLLLAGAALRRRPTT
jgi:hypothetical protein